MSMDEDDVMSIADIIEDWVGSNRRFPEKALREAMNRRGEMTPVLLEEMRDVAKFPDCLTGDDDYWISLYALYILAAFREPGILPILEKLFAATGDNFNELWGDYVAEDDRRLFASWAFSEPDALKRIIEAENINDSIRGAALEGLGVLCADGVVSDDSYRTYLRHLGENVFRREPVVSESIFDMRYDNDSWVWFIWTQCCFAFRFEELYPLAKAAFEEHWIDRHISDWEHEEKALADNPDPAQSRASFGDLIDDPVEELKGWECFSPEMRRRNRRRERENARKIPATKTEPRRHPDTIVNAAPKPKPNQPCPCGSGKKFKKCCGRK